MHLKTRDSYSESPKGRKSRRSRPNRRNHVIGKPTWELAQMFPVQGQWTEEEFFALDNRGIEYNNGVLEFLPVPTELHQLIMLCFYHALFNYSRATKSGVVITSGLKVRVAKSKYREPDVVFIANSRDTRRGNQYWESADLAMEVVSEGDEARERDLATKRREYAQAGIAEYWIADPLEHKVTILKLKGRRYVTHGIYEPGDVATSALLSEFKIDVHDLLAGKVE